MSRASRLFLISALWMTSGAVGATDFYKQLAVSLVKPSGQDFLNVKSCQEAAAVELEISWDLNETPLWIDSQDADVFLAADNTCASAQVEIGKKSGEGVDATISTGQRSGTFPVGNDELFLSQVTGLNCAAESEKDYYFCIKWTYEENVGLYTNKYIYRGGAKLRFDTKPPGAPVLTQVLPGEANLKVSWEEPADDDIEDYLIYYRAQGSGETKQVRVTDAATTSRQITGLQNGVTYEIWMTAVDVAENEGAVSERLTGTPEPVEDFWEHYHGAGGQEDGGFCFVATAAFGSYLHPQVAKLRGFRDGVLGRSELGRELIAGYYRFGPRWARALCGSESLKSLTRLWIAPVSLVAGAWQALGGWTLLGLAVASGGLPWLVLRRRRRRAPRDPEKGARCGQKAGGRFLLVVVVGLAVLATPSAGRADESEEPIGLEAVQPRFQFQARFGFYHPAIDSEAGLTGEPFREIFGGSSRFLFELELDWEFFRLFGPVYAGGSLGFVQYLGKALTGSGNKSSDTNVLNLLPLRFSLGYAFDGLYSWWGLPFLPYLSGGLDYYIWWVLDGVGDVASFADTEGRRSKARGGIFGAHFSAGLKILLDALDREAAGNLQAQTGIINSFLFVEYALSWIDGLGSGAHLDLSDDTIMFGLMMEF